MRRQPVKSGMVRSVGYDPNSQILEVEFVPKKGETKGAVFQYSKCIDNRRKRFSSADFQDMLRAESIGKYINTYVKGVFEFQKVIDGPEDGVPVEESVQNEGKTEASGGNRAS
jgi:KTSC domain